MFFDVTFVELLSYTAGMISDLTTLNDWDSYFTDQSSLTQQRYRLIKEILKKQPEVSKGTYLYSNAGYIVAAAMIERITNKSWEELISTNIFQPLDMNYTGFGPPKPALEEPQGILKVDYAQAGNQQIPIIFIQIIQKYWDQLAQFILHLVIF
jgi:CubicO group peptidase (beta-lactamase class C family)